MGGTLGQEIGASGFAERDFSRFQEQLFRETAQLRQSVVDGQLSSVAQRIGFELEAWLVDRSFYPVPHNQSFLARLDDPLVVPELSRFNIEVNGPPQMLRGQGLAQMEASLRASWDRCIAVAHEEVDTVVAIGTLPTLRDADLSPENMTPSNRYVALNRELMRQRGDAPIAIEIDATCRACEPLRTSHSDVLLEAAATSFQLHWQVPVGRFADYFNASLVVSGPLMAISANSPFLFGQPLWHETRIAIFEQAFEQAARDGDAATPHRVTFGNGYLGSDPCAVFDENCALYPVLLPFDDGIDPAHYPCLRLHNGTIWRWNRPLVGFDDDGKAHLRIEQRILPAGPSIADMMANAALYYGLSHMLANRPVRPDHAIPFEAARANFYAAARHGLDAEILWLDGRVMPAREVLLHALPLMREGLHLLGVDDALAERHCDVIRLRTETGQTGSAWQLAHHERNGDIFRMTAEYAEHQRSGMPVHEWLL